MGIRPASKLVARNGEVTTWRSNRQTPAKSDTVKGDIFEMLKDRAWLAIPLRMSLDCHHLPPAPSAFSPMIRCARSRQLPSLAEDDLQLPDACLAFFHEVIAFDHVKKELLLIVNADVRAQAPKAAYAAASRRIAALERQLAKPLPPSRRRKRTGRSSR